MFPDSVSTVLFLTFGLGFTYVLTGKPDQQTQRKDRQIDDRLIFHLLLHYLNGNNGQISLAENQ